MRGRKVDSDVWVSSFASCFQDMEELDIDI